MGRIAVLAALAAAALLLAAPAAQAKVTVHYTSSHVSVSAWLGGGPYAGVPWYTGGWPAYGTYVGGPWYGGYYINYSPNWRPGLPYLPPGTIYTPVVNSYYPYPYGYSRGYGYWPGGFYDAYMNSTPGVYRPAATTAPSATSTPVVNNISVNVYAAPAGAAPSAPAARPAGSWDQNEWRIPVTTAPVQQPQVQVVVGQQQAPAPSNGYGATGQPIPARPGAPGFEHRGQPAAAPAQTTAAPQPQVTATAPPPAQDGQDRNLTLLMRGNDGERQVAARELKKVNTRPVIEALIDALQRDGKAGVREEAAKSLGAMLAVQSLPALWQAAREDPEQAVRRAARESALKIEAFTGGK